MRGRGEHALDGGEFFRDERRDLLQARAVDEHQQVVAAGHEIAGFHLVELADALGQAVEPAAALGRDAHFDDGADDAGIFMREIQHGAKAEQHAVLFEGFKLGVQFSFGQLKDLRELWRGEAIFFKEQFYERSHIFGQCCKKRFQIHSKLAGTKVRMNAAT